jgi:hypothetical protein
MKTYIFFVIPFYLQSILVHSANCVKTCIQWHVEECSVALLCKSILWSKFGMESVSSVRWRTLTNLRTLNLLGRKIELNFDNWKELRWFSIRTCVIGSCFLRAFLNYTLKFSFPLIFTLKKILIYMWESSLHITITLSWMTDCCL